MYGRRTPPAPSCFSSESRRLLFFCWMGGLPRLQCTYLEAFLAAAATSARVASMAFYSPHSRYQQAEAFRAAFLQTEGLPLDDVFTADDIVSAFADAGSDCA